MNTKQNNLAAAETVTEADRTLAERVGAVLASLEPIFRHEGGHARLVSVKNEVAHIELTNEMCEGCGSALTGMEGGLRLMLMERIPCLKEVVFE
jgi:Fe-S cluster biogenesis protein NfuA